MKRVICYTTEDGQRFATRALARRHEISILRRKRVGECIRRLLKTPSEEATFTVTAIADEICKHAAEFAEALSARAVVRAARATAPKPTRSNA